MRKLAADTESPASVHRARRSPGSGPGRGEPEELVENENPVDIFLTRIFNAMFCAGSEHDTGPFWKMRKLRIKSQHIISLLSKKTTAGASAYVTLLQNAFIFPFNFV